MITFIIRRLIAAVGLLLVISALTFAIFFIIPKLAGQSTDALAARYVGKAVTPELLAGIKEQYGLDRPVIVQYWDFLTTIFTGDTIGAGEAAINCPAPCFGYSNRTNSLVWDMLVDRAPVTFSLAIGAAVLWLLAGITIGVISALRKGSIFDRISMGTALMGVSLPIFFTALLAQQLFVYQWDILPQVQYISFTDNPLKWATNLIIPWVTLAFLYAALYARLTRAGMLETMNEDYIRTARAKGLKEGNVITKHALRAALTPIITIFGLDLGALLGGAVLTETATSLPGLGRLSIDAIHQNDLAIVLGVVMTAALFIVLANLIVDILYAVVDPRVRLG